MQIGSDVLVEVVRLTAPMSTDAKSVVEGVLAAAAGQPPGGAAYVPPAGEPAYSFAAVFAALKNSGIPAVAAAAQDELHQVCATSLHVLQYSCATAAVCTLLAADVGCRCCSIVCMVRWSCHVHRLMHCIMLCLHEVMCRCWITSLYTEHKIFVVSQNLS